MVGLDTLVSAPHHHYLDELWNDTTDKDVGLQYAKAMQLRTIAIDISEAQLDSARSLGADLVFNPATQPDYCEKIKAATNDGVHAAAIFSAANAAYETAPNVLRYQLFCPR